MLRIVTQNIRHGGGSKSRLSDVIDLLQTYDADILVISEFRNNAAGESIEKSLIYAGYVLFKNLADPALNSLLIAARCEGGVSSHGTLSCSQRLSLVRVAGISLCGVYMPNLTAKIPYWESILSACDKSEKPNLFIGDFNTGSNELDRVEGSVRYVGADYIHKLEAAGYCDLYRSKNGERREYSWISYAGNGFRLDHAFGDDGITARTMRCYYDHRPREYKITDHSALVLELE